MRNKKKIAGVITAAVLTGVMPITASANGTVNQDGGSKEITVTGNYEEGTESATVYKVDLVWNAMEFTYTDASEGTWNPDTHQYDGSTAAVWSWDNDANAITVTNHSNTAIDAAFEYTGEPGFEAVTADFFDATQGGNLLTESKIALDSAEPEQGSQTGEAKSGAAYLQITGGALSQGVMSQEIGTVTVTIHGTAQP